MRLILLLAWSVFAWGWAGSASAQDADGDTISDEDEAGADGVGVDTDGDGIDDDLDLDSDGDGIPDATEAGDADPRTPPVDSDGDGDADFRDLDSDDDGISDAVEGVVDTDGDGTPDYLDQDSDGDGWADIDESELDQDGDGVPGFRDPDMDGDGTIDGLDVCPTVDDPDQADLDGDGEGDACEDDLDGDTILDADDNCPRFANRDQSDRDGDGLGDLCDGVDSNGDGVEDRFEATGGACSVGAGGASGKGTSFLWLFGLLLLVGLRRRRIALALAIGVFAFSAPATAQVVEPQDFAIERFHPATDRGGILDVEWGSVPAHLDVQGTAVLTYSNDPLIARDSDQETEFGLIDHRLAGEVLVALPLFDILSLSVGLPFTLYQSREDVVDGTRADLPPLVGGGVGDLRIVPKVQLLRQERHRVALSLLPAFSIPLGDEDGYLRERDWTFSPAVAVSYGSGVVRVAFNLGYTLRAQEEILGLIVDDEVNMKLGIALRFAENGGPPLELDLSVYYGFSAPDPLTHRAQTPFEVRAGLAWDLHPNLSVFGAVGTGLLQGWGIPDVRAILGVRAGLIAGEELCAEGPEDLDGFEDDDGCADLDNDEDGWLDEVDECPLEAEDVDGFEDEDGCADLDDDGDGILDADDACPREAETVNGIEDADGCPEQGDTDGDGILDALDQCPSEAEDVDGVQDEDGCPEEDADQDGVPDADDGCPVLAGPAEGGGCPLPDRDGDGIADRVDSCPDEPGTAEFRGCAAAPRVTVEEDRITLVDKIYFVTNSAELHASAHPILDALATVLIAHPEILRVEVQGHTDDVGASARNLRLSQQRADAVKAYLVAQQVSAERLVAIGHGETRPVRRGQSADDRELNRRVEFLVTEREMPEGTTTPAPE